MSSTSKRGSTSSSSSRTPTKRLLTELSAYNSSPPSSHPGIESLAPVSSSNLLSLRAILTGSAPPSSSSKPASHPQEQQQQTHPSYPPVPPSSGYTHGRWLLSIRIPDTYPNSPPLVTFVTKICHPNVKWETGEICLDVLKENWTPVLGVVGVLESVVRLLGEPGVDSPLGVEVAALLRGGDSVGARALVGFWCGEESFEGVIEEGEER